MSYILDALKKAEAERRIGAPVVGLPAAHTVPVVPPAAARHASVWRTPWPWVAITAIAALLSGFAWWSVASKAPQQIQASAPPLSQPPQAQTLAAVLPPTHSLPSSETKERPQPPEPKIVKPKEKKRTLAEESKTSEPPIAILHELPDNIQHEIPQLSIGGYIYTANKASRSVLINGRLLRDGEEIAPGFTLERMMPTGMVLNYKGYRYRTSY